MVKAVYLAGNSYPHDRALEERVTHFLSARLGISAYPQSSLIPPPEQLTVDPLDPTLRLETLATLIDSIDERVILIGRSSGARVITQFAEQHPDKIAACICFGFPFQSPGQPPEDWRTKHLLTLSLPTLIIQGTHDRYGHENLHERFSLNPRTKILHVDADHESIYSEQDWLSITNAIEKLIRLTTEESISQRCVFYVSGLDPRGEKQYYELFKTELTKGHEEISITTRKTTRTQKQSETNTTECSVDTPASDRAPGTHTDFQFLGWNDIARKHWPTNRFKQWLSYIRVTPRYLLSGFFQKYTKLSATAAKNLLSPNILILLTALACVLITTLTYVIGSLVLTTVTETTSTPPINKALLAAIAVGACWLVWRFAQRFENSHQLDWIIRSYAFTAKQAHDEIPEIDTRLDQFAQQIIARVQKNRDDEIIIVGHSSGAMMAVSALARAIERYPKLFEHPAKMGLLTLDQCLPMLGLLPRATTFRSELGTLATQRELLWVDLSSATDPLCTPGVNPFDACGVKRLPDGYGIQLCLRDPTSLTVSEITTGSPSLHRQFERHIPIPLPEDFHAATYLRLNPDVLRSGMSAEEHYRRHGAKEHRRFCISVPAGFEPALYLALNPDVAQAGVDPFIHYTLHGVQENRRYQTA